MASSSVSCLGVACTIECDDAEIVQQVVDAYPSCATDRTDGHRLRLERGADGSYALQVDGASVTHMATRSLAFAQLVWEINQLVVHAPTRYLLVHAAAAVRDRRAALIVGASGAGKSTLVAALAAAGWGYLTDEVSAIDLETGTVQPYPKPIALDRRSRLLLHVDAGPDIVAGHAPDEHAPDDAQVKRPIAVGTLGGYAGEAAPLSVIVMPSIAGAAPVEPITRAAAMMGIAEQCFNLAERGANGFSGLAALVRATTVAEIALGDLDHAVARLAAEVPSPGASGASGVNTSPPGASGASGVNTVEEFDGELVILDRASMRLHHLNAAAALVWHACDGASTLEEVVAALASATERERDEIRPEIAEAVEQLTARGLLGLW